MYMTMKKSLFIPLLALLAMTGCRQDDLPAGQTRLTLNLQPQRPATVTRSVDESTLADANLFVYREGENRPFAHSYTTDPYFVVDMEPAVYTFYVVGNAHRDMGELTQQELVDCKELGIESDGTLLMTGRTTENIDFSTHLLKLQLYRQAARIAYNVTVAQPAIDAGIRIQSVQLSNEPDAAPLYETADRTPADAGYGASEERPAEEGGTAATGTFYMLPNKQGTVPSIVSQDQKNRQNAPENAAHLRIRGTRGGTTLEYIVYLGANNTDDFNVNSNEAHTYDVTIWSDTQTDTRITRYLMECDDRWPESRYLSVSDKGVLAYAIENTTDHTLVGQFTLLQGEAEALTVMEGGEARQAPCEFPVTTNGQLALSYTPTLIREGKNSKLEYQAELTDETGRSITYTFAHEFANRVEVYIPKGISSDQVTAANAVDRTSTPEKAIVWCYEGGCDLTITGERFDGWYADADLTQKLSAEQTFRYVPTQAESRIYTKFIPEARIQCRETAKNATYMNNVNTVDLTVEGYTGQVIVKAVCEQGGVFTAGAEQTVTIESGSSITLPENIVFVPTEAGEATYTIEAYLPSGTKIGETKVTNTIAPTKLVPKIRLYYANLMPQLEVQLQPGNPYYSWAGYNDVYADVTFTPELDYSIPLKGKQLLKIEIKPAGCTEQRYDISENQYETDLWHVGYQSGDIGAPPLDPITAVYPAALANPLIDIAGIANYFGENDYYMALFNPDFPTPDGEYYEYPDLGTLTRRPFLWIEMGDPITASRIAITKLYSGSDILLETNIDEIKQYFSDEVSY